MVSGMSVHMQQECTYCTCNVSSLDAMNSPPMANLILDLIESKVTFIQVLIMWPARGRSYGRDKGKARSGPAAWGPRGDRWQSYASYYIQISNWNTHRFVPCICSALPLHLPPPWEAFLAPHHLYVYFSDIPDHMEELEVDKAIKQRCVFVARKHQLFLHHLVRPNCITVFLPPS